MLTCPIIHPTPFLSVTCPWGAKYGSQCEFDCDLGSVRNGSKIVVCEKKRSGNYGYWTWDGRQPHCQGMRYCTDRIKIQVSLPLVSLLIENVLQLFRNVLKNQMFLKTAPLLVIIGLAVKCAKCSAKKDTM